MQKPSTTPILTVAEYKRTSTKKFLRSKQWQLQRFLVECSNEFLDHLFDFTLNKAANEQDNKILDAAEMAYRDRWEAFDGTGYPKTVYLTLFKDGKVLVEPKESQRQEESQTK